MPQLRLTQTISYFFCLLTSLLYGQSSINADFELSAPGVYTASNSVLGWTLSSSNASACPLTNSFAPGASEFSIVSTPIVSLPLIGTLANSPLGGTRVARLNNATSNNSITKIAQTFTVGPLTNFVFSYAGVAEGGNHSCCDQSHFKIQLLDNSGSIIACQSLTLNGSTNASCSNATANTISNSRWTNWDTRYMDLTPYINSFVTLEVIASDCSFGDHAASVYFDAVCTNTTTLIVCPPVYYQANNFGINYCASSSSASIQGPLGYSTYSWVAPNTYSSNPIQSNGQSSIAIANPIANSVFSLYVNGPNGCPIVSTVSLVSSTISALGITAAPSCSTGASGSATVFAGGGNGNYNYVWTNSTNSVISTSSVLINVASGQYSVSIASPNFSPCGTASAIATIGTRTSNLIQVLQPFCGGSAFLNAPSGTNYQWYIGNSAISGSLGGTNASFTVSNAINLGVISVTHITSQGCLDSIRYTLLAVPPGSLNVNVGPQICSGALNATASITFSPSVGNNFSWLLNSIGPTPTYSASNASNSAAAITFTNLAGGTYSVKVMDGACLYGTTFTINSFNFNYTLSSSASTVCSGNSAAAQINFTNSVSPNQYNYAWSPATWIAGNTTSVSSVILFPQTPVATSATIIYTVVVTPSLMNCPLTKTIAITAVNPAVASISTIPTLCANAALYPIIVNPTGGNFYYNSGVTLVGSISASNCALGTNTCTYIYTLSTCASSKTFSFVVAPAIPASLLGPSAICIGQSATLSTSGLTSFTWNTGQTSTSIVATPSITTSYSIIGTNSTNCLYAQNLTVSVVAYPVLSIAGASATCAGQSQTLIASGADTYSWSNGTTVATLNANPQQTTTYSLVGTNAGLCSSSTTATLLINPNPTLTVFGSSALCLGETQTLSAVGAQTIFWNGQSASSSFTTSPLVSTTYTATGLNNFGCQSTATLNLSVSNCDGLAENSRTNRLYIQNPFQDVLVIHSENTLKVNIFDSFGKLVYSDTLVAGTCTINTSDLPLGIYLIRIRTNQTQEVKKLIKN